MNPTLEADLRVGELLTGRYRLGPVIGHGGMAQVYRAQDLVLDRPVAVKVFRPGAVEHAATARQRDEARILAGLEHPNLVRVFDADTDPGTGCSFLVMELVEGVTVSAALADGGPMPPALVAAIGAQLGDAVAAVHRAGIVHRDIKPANVLLTQPAPDATGHVSTDEVSSDQGSDDDTTGQGAAGPVARLTDFGIARFVEATRLTTTGLLIGTAQYLSPEQTLGEPVGCPSDVYTLGLLLLECLTGQVEFPGSPVESAVARLYRQPVIPTGLGPRWVALLGSMTARDPNQRPTAADAAAVLRNLGGAVSGTATLPVDPLPAAMTSTVDRDRRPDTAARTTGHDTAQRHRVHRNSAGHQGVSGGGARSGAALQTRWSTRRWSAAAAAAAAAVLTVAALTHAAPTSTPAAHPNGSSGATASSGAGTSTPAGGHTAATGAGVSASGPGSPTLGAGPSRSGPSRSGPSRSATARHRSPGSSGRTAPVAPASARPAAGAAPGPPSTAAQLRASAAAQAATGAAAPVAGPAAPTTHPKPTDTSSTAAAHTPTPTSTASTTSTAAATPTSTATGSPSSSTSHGRSAAHKPAKHHGNPHHR